MINRQYVWISDGFATAHHCPFADDMEFEAQYREMERAWAPEANVQWRMWTLSALARQCQGLPGNFAEFGVWRGGCAFMIMSRTTVSEDHRFFLFDTFAGTPLDRLTRHEREVGFASGLGQTSLEYVDEVLARWRPRYSLHPGDVFETLSTVDVGDLSFAHVDLNAMAPSRLALEYAYEHMIPGGVIVFDDYGFASYSDQRVMIDEFFDTRPETLVVLPTGQAFALKR
jgi:O-methyltransferase